MSTKSELLGSTKRYRLVQYLAHNGGCTLAELEGRKSGNRCIGVTWNKSKDRPAGFPNSRAHQQWMVLPEAIAELVEENLGRVQKKIGPPPGHNA